MIRPSVLLTRKALLVSKGPLYTARSLLPTACMSAILPSPPSGLFHTADLLCKVCCLPEIFADACHLWLVGGSRLAIIGDIHGWYGAHDPAALTALQADITCIVGDIGEENLDLVTLISELPVPKAVILGNHDGW